jgi:DNA-binding LytR/AlgR family response regulator
MSLEQPTIPRTAETGLHRATASAASEDSVFIRSGLRYYHIRFADIQVVEAQKNYCRITTTNGQFLVQDTLANLDVMLPPPLFCRIHRSFIVGISHVKTFDRRTVRVADQELPIGETYLRDLLQARPVVGAVKPE